jgi:hypothetical protein
MIDELIPFMDCGCPPCLRSAAKNFIQIGEELAFVANHIHPEDVRPHRTPVELPHSARQLSASGLRAAAASVRGLADQLE